MKRADMEHEDIVSKTKEYLSKDEYRIQLHDTVVAEIKAVRAQAIGDDFNVQGVGWSEDEFRNRVAKYDKLTENLCAVQGLLGYWATERNLPTVTLAPRRLIEPLNAPSGVRGWVALRWYPALALLYSGGVAAVAASRYENLRALLETSASSGRGEDEPLLLAITTALTDVGDAFKLLTGHERYHVPRSEHLFETLRPLLDNLLFLGADYEQAFDRFEVMLSLEYTHLSDGNWAPVGRFGWKMHRDQSPLRRVVAEASQYGENWPPLRAGLFGGSAVRFNEVAQRISYLVERLGWS